MGSGLRASVQLRRTLGKRSRGEGIWGKLASGGGATGGPEIENPTTVQGMHSEPEHCEYGGGGVPATVQGRHSEPEHRRRKLRGDLVEGCRPLCRACTVSLSTEGENP